LTFELSYEIILLENWRNDMGCFENDADLAAAVPLN